MNAKHVRTAVGLLLLLSSTPREAAASGYLVARFGMDHGTAATPNAFAVYYNPAALGGTKGTSLVLDGTLVIRSLSYTRGTDALSPAIASSKADPNYSAANTGKASLLGFTGLPYLGVVSDLGMKDLRVGYAAYVPFGGSTEWNKAKSWEGSSVAPGAVDGPQRWHNISGSTMSIYNTLAVAYRLGDTGLSIGLNGSIVYNNVKTVRARNITGGDDIRIGSGALLEGRSYLEAKVVNAAAAAGLYWQGADGKARAGASYTIKPGFKQMRMPGTVTQQFGTDAIVAQPQNVDFLQTYPDVIRAGGAYRLSQAIELRADFLWVRWSAFKSQCVVNRGTDCAVTPTGGDASPSGSDVVLNIPRDWKDTFGGRVGVGWFASDALEVFGSVAFNTSPVPKDTMDVTSFDSFRLYFTAGARYAISKEFYLAGSYTQLYFAPVDTGKSSTLFTNYTSPSRSPSADGKYSSWVGLVNANLGYNF